MQREQEEQREECAMIIKAPPHGRAQMYPMWHMYIHIKTKKVLKKVLDTQKWNSFIVYLSLWATVQNPIP